MTEQNVKRVWRVIGESVPGATHLRAGIPNQDAILQLRETGTGAPLVVSVSDGHGSDKCFRSDRGSRFAVNTATQLLREFINRARHRALSEIEDEARRVLPQEFVKRWREAVEADLARNPLKAEELETLEKNDGARARKLVEENTSLAYGATSLTVAVDETFILYLQLGDGEILTVSDEGEVRRPLPDDERLFANETTSLCSDGAGEDFRIQLHSLAEQPPPALILLSTDGYVNSFSDEAGFLKVGSDLLSMLRSDGYDSVNESLRGWLEEATRMGSGDDTTVAIICRMDALRQPPAASRGEPAATSAESEPPPAPPENQSA